MRDPDGTIEFQAHSVVRSIRPSASAKPFLQSSDADSLVKTGKLVPFRFIDPDTVESPRVPFVSYPFEWCDAQLYSAAELTLDISREIFRSGYELKDASSWNVIFQGNQPVFCDHLSFQPIDSRQWWAFGQFTRHFLLPLAVSRHRGLKPHQCFSIYRDGIPPDAARNMLGLKRYLTRYWPLMATGGSKLQATDGLTSVGKPLHHNLYGFCRSMLNGIKPCNPNSQWSNYTKARQHYDLEASADKYQKVAEWLEKTQPAWVIDLGCNTGEFTLLSAKSGANVIAIDLDHDSVQQLVLSQCNSLAIHPLVTNLGDMVGGRGWGGDEFPSLVSRLHHRSDMLLMLALIHHLAISEGIYLSKIAEMASDITREYLIVELLNEADKMVMHLCSQRKRDPKDFSMAAQMAAFAKYFKVVASYSIPNTSRTLSLLQKNQP
jgi:hypothetical protein